MFQALPPDMDAEYIELTGKFLGTAHDGTIAQQLKMLF